MSLLTGGFAVVILSGAWLNSFRAESTPPIATAGEAAEMVNKAQVTPFILVVKTDQMEEKNALVGEKA